MGRITPKVVVMAVLAVAVAGMTAATVSARDQRDSVSLQGGTYRVGWESAFGFTDAFDPTGEYLGDAWGVLNNLLVRALVGTNHVAGPAGNKLVPDLATAVPKPTNGGTRYTFTLKTGIKFGPPVRRAITSRDVLAAFERVARPKNGAQYAFYYSPIDGFDAYGKGETKKIAGIQTPNARTIVFRLTRPTGDFLYRLAMPATAPIPTEVTKCFEGKAGVYGRNLVSSGPYMIEGSDKLDASSCSSLKPASGFDGNTKLILVRNPDYDPKTDTRAARENHPDRFEFLVNTNADDIFSKVKAGELENEVATEPPKVLREYVTSSSLRSRLHQNSGDRTWFIPLNLTQPPFDDLHVRRAMNFVLDKEALRKTWGGETAGSIATHIVPDTLFNFRLKGYDPYKSPGHRGDAAKAQAEIKQSRYDTNKDGQCDAPACKGVLMIADTRGVDPGMTAVIQSSARKIGITFTVRTIRGAYPTIQTPSKNVPISERPGWGKDYADPLTFFNPMFDGRTIIANGNINYPLVGLTPSLAKQLGVKGNVTNVPNVNADLDRCSRLSATARQVCYQNLDKKLMTQVVPWVPWLWSFYTDITGPKAGKYVFDQFSTTPAYAHLSVQS